jgi:hypothetical protein
MAQFHQDALDNLPLAWLPGMAVAEGLSRFGLSQACALFEPHAVVAQIRLQPIAQLGGAFDGFTVDGRGFS